MPEAQPSSYEILAKLSRATNAPAELFAARATGVERLVVIKRLRRDAAKEASIAQAFLAEARVAAKLAHPNIAQVYEVGKLGGSYFFTTEFVDGESLGALIAHARSKKVQVPIRAFLTIAAGAAAGLHHAHERNGIDGKSLAIVHGNISPTSVMISREGIVKVLDFGLPRSATTKPAYSSPEQIRGDKLDRRSDLYSLGVVLWELLTLGDLNARDNDEETRNAVATYEPPPPSARRFDVPPELDAILVKLLAKGPADRYQSGGDLITAIEALAVKLGFSLSTTDLARMVRLWFTPSAQGEEEPEPTPITVTSQDILSEVPAGPDPVDDLLASVHEAAAFIRSMAQKLNAGRPLRITNTPVPTGPEHEATREDFAQIRDRILDEARKRKESKSPPVGTPVAAVAVEVEPTPPSPSDGAATDEPTRRKRHDTLNPRNNPYSYITAVAETATAPIANVTKVDSNVALKALQSTQQHVESSTSSVVANDEVAKPSAIVDRPSDATTVVTPLDSLAAATKVDPAKATATESAKSNAASEARLDAKPSTKSDTASDATSAAKPDAKSAAKPDAKSAAKPDAKSAAKSDAKSAAKPDAKSAAKPDTKSAAKSDAKSASKSASHRTSSKTNGVSANGVSKPKDAAARTTATEADDADESDRRGGWLMPAVVVVAAAVVLIFVLKGRGNDKTSASGSGGSSQVVTTTNVSGSAATDPTSAGSGAPVTAVVTATAVGSNAGSSDATGSTAGSSTTGSATEANAAATSSAGSAVVTATAGSTAATTTSGAGSATLTAGAGSNATGANAGDKTTTGTNTGEKTTTGTNTGEKTTGTNTGEKTTGTNTGEKTTTGTHTGDNTTTGTNTGDKSGTKTGDKTTNTTGTKTADKTGTKTGDKTTKTSGTKTGDKTTNASDTKTGDKTTNTSGTKTGDKTTNTGTKTGDKTSDNASDKNVSIEHLYSKGDYAKTNAACAKNLIFTPKILESCALAACRTSNTTLAKRWVNAIAKSARPDVIAQCKSLGLELDTPPPAPAPESAPAPTP